jgi:hypothetical protein
LATRASTRSGSAETSCAPPAWPDPIVCLRMTDTRTWSVRIPLARDRWRLIAIVGSRAAIGAAGLATSRGTPGTLGVAIFAISLAVLLYVPLLTLWLATVRAEVRAGRLDLVWALRRQRYPLVPGPVSRLSLTRVGRRALDASVQGFGLAIGSGFVNNEPLIVLRLSFGAPLIVVPTQRGRVAIAPADEGRYVAALAEAARLVRVAAGQDGDRPPSVERSRTARGHDEGPA